MKGPLNRRSFLRISALTGAFMGIPSLGLGGKTPDIEELLDRISATPSPSGQSVIGLTVPPIKQVRVGIIGLGMRGSGMTKLIDALCPDKAKIVAICDLQEKYTSRTLEALKKNNQNPAVYKGDPNAWKEMVKRDDIDLVFIFTHWDVHVEMAVESMRQGKHVAVEVPAAITLEEAWQMVNTAEETQRNCIMLENCCYGSEELWLLNMARQGVFGNLTYGEAAYIHDLRSLMLDHSYYNQWRIRHHVKHDANLYPTHGLGPVSQYMEIDRGDRFEYLVSMSSPSVSLAEYSKKMDYSNEFYNRNDFIHGDMNTSLIKTAKGRMIHLYHDVVTPRPYSRNNCLAGTGGYHEGYPSRLALDGKDSHRWLPDNEYKEMRAKYDHPIWTRLKAEIEKYGGHGGMDFVEIYRVIDNLNRGIQLDMDVYDAASWSVVYPLSEISVQLGSVPVKFPDFTRGRWKEPRKLQILLD
ncbi:MAG: Gfo/Idh/MocA family oxidoreductase [Bacteroidales bacterium]|nr:Gfo/Idh/MocA family oxidoreductase [Bacteroidales bacterium]